MAGSSTAALTVVALVPLVGWSIYRRIRRLVGRQRLGRVRPWITVVMFPLLLAMLSASAFVLPQAGPQRLWWLAGGLVLGAAAAVLGLKRTRFEATAEGLYYTPDSRIGITISGLFVARIVYRLGALAIHGAPPPQDASFALSPYTLAPVGLLSGYFMVYAAGLILGRWRMLRARRQQQQGATP